MPMSCALGTRTTAWQKVFPNVVPALLSGTILHFVPIIRDVLQAMGGLEVRQVNEVVKLELLNCLTFFPFPARRSPMKVSTMVLDCSAL